MSTASTRRCIRCNAEVPDGKMFYREQEGDFCIGPYCWKCFHKETEPVKIPDPERICTTCGKNLDGVGAVRTSKDGKTIVLECWDCWNSEAEAQDTATRLATATALLKELAEATGLFVCEYESYLSHNQSRCVFCEEVREHDPDCLITRAAAFVKEARHD